MRFSALKVPTDDRGVRLLLGLTRIPFAAAIIAGVQATHPVALWALLLLSALAAIDVIGSTVAAARGFDAWGPNAITGGDLALLLVAIAVGGGPESIASPVIALLPLLSVGLHRPREVLLWGVAALIGFAAVSASFLSGMHEDARLQAFLVYELLVLGATITGFVICSAFTERARRIEESAVAQRLLVEEALELELRERRVLAEVLHDDVLQLLLASRQDIVEAREGDTEALAWADRQIGRAVHSLRELIRGRYGAPAAKGGLERELRDSLAEILRRSPIRSALRIEADHDSAHDKLIVSLSRELVNNAVKHSGAAELTVVVRARKAESLLELEVCDDGVGMDMSKLSGVVSEGHIGLASVRMRVSSVGGRCEFESSPGNGMRVRALLPIAPD